MKTIYTLIVAALVSFSAVAQDDAIVSFTKQIIDAQNKLSSTKNKQEVLDFYDRKFQGNLSYVNIAGELVIENLDYYRLGEMLTKAFSTEGVNKKYTIGEIFKVSTKGNTSVISFETNYEVYKDGGIITKGTQLSQYTFQKMGNSWKVIQSFTSELEDEKMKGTCLVKLFNGNDNEYLAKLTIPNGSNYNVEIANFNFSDRVGGKAVTTDFGTYSWIDGKTVFLQEGGNPKAREIGVGASNQDVIKVILVNQFPSNCTNIRVQ